MAAVASSSPTPFEEAVPLLAALKSEYSRNLCDLSKCRSILKKLKLLIHFFPSSPPTPTALRTEEVLLSVEVLELGAAIAIRCKDTSSFERYFAQLSTYYQDFRDILPKSEKQYLIVGLNLLYLLSTNNIGEFHMTLQLLTADELSNRYVKFAIDLEEDLAAGNYKKILASRNDVPDPMFVFFTSGLVDTVRLKMAKCLEKSYEAIQTEDAASMLLLNSLEELKFFVATENKRKEAEGETDIRWVVEDAILRLEKKPHQPQEVAAMELIDNCLGYATELELIV